MTRRNRRNNRTSKRGEEIPPPSDRHAFWVPAHDDIDEHDMVYEGGPMRLATPSPQRSNRTAETSDQAHSARDEVEENSASARSADNEEESAVTSSTAETSVTTSDVQHTSHSTTAPPHDGYDSDELSEATPRQTLGRSDDVAEPHGNETEETSAPARSAGNEEEAAAYTMPEARTLSELRAQIHRMHVELQRARHNLPGVPALHQIWSDEWKTAPDTHHLWQLFLALQPVVATRQAEDLQRLYGDNTITQSSSSTSVTDASAPVPNESMDTDAAPATSVEATVAESPLDVSDTPSDLDYRTDKTRSPQYEPIPSPVHHPRPPPPPRPTDPRRPSTVEEDVDELITDFRLPPAKPATQQQFRNPSPPPVGPTRSVGYTGEATVEETRSVPDTRKAPKIQKAQLAATVATANATKPKGSGNQQRTTVRTVKKSGQTSASSDGHQSRSSTGSKRSRVSDGRSYPPPTKRTGSRSPTRKPSRSLERHVQRKKNSQHRLMVPVIDGCVYKDMAIDTAKTNHQPSAWQTEFDLPHNPYELLGVINHFCVPSTNLPPTAVTRHAENPLTPYVDHTFEQALLEDTIIPWKFILGSTIGCAPTYWRFTGTKAREYLYKAFDRNNLYRSKVNACGIGPTGFDLRSGGYLVTGEYAGQRENIVRYGRIARNVRMPLVIHVEYDYLPEGVTNLHDEAIKALRNDAELSSRHRIHLVAFKATALDLIHWLEEFPPSRVNTNDEHYRHASALKKFLIHVSLDNLGLHSGCPKNLTVPGTYKTPSMLLRAARKFEELTGTPGDRLLEFNAANLVDMYDLNPDLLDRSTNTKDLRDPAIGPRLTIRELSFTIRALFGQAPRVDLRDQGGRSPSRRRRASIAEESPTAELMETDDAHVRSNRSRSSAGRSRKDPSPPRRSGGRTQTPVRRSRNDASKADPARSAGDAQAKNKSTQRLDPARSAGDNPAKGRHQGGQDQTSHDRSQQQRSQDAPTASHGKPPPTVKSTIHVKATPIGCPPGSRLEGRIERVTKTLHIGSQQPARAAAPRRDAPPPKRVEYTGPPMQFVLNMTEPAPQRTADRRLIIRTPDPRFFKSRPVHDGILPQEPSIDDICRYFEQLFHAEDPDKPLRTVYESSLSTTTMPFSYTENFEVPRVPAPRPNPWDPTKPCSCRNVDHELHQTTEEFGLITKKKWANKDVIEADKTGYGLKSILADTMQLEIQSFGQMIFLKYADRLKGNGIHTGWILRFMNEILQTTSWSGMIDLLREFKERMTLPSTTNPWPWHGDIYAAAESWCCYCPDAYSYVFTHLSGPINFTPDWLSVRMMPREVYTMLEDFDPVYLFDYLRNRLYSQYCLPHIEALEGYQHQLVWARFEKTKKSKGELCEMLDHSTVVFTDDVTYNQYHENLRAGVTMIRIDVSSRASALHDIRRFYATSKVKRVVFWFGHRVLLNQRLDLCQLLSEVCYHYEEHFPNVEKYVVMPAYNRRLRGTWTSQVLGTYLQRDEILPNTRVVILSTELQLWDLDYRAEVAGNELTPWPLRHIDEEGLRHSDPDLFLDRVRLRRHDLDLWIEIDETIPEPSTGAVARPATNPETSATAKTTADIDPILAAALPADVLTPEVKARLLQAEEAMRSRLTDEATLRTKQELKPQFDKMDAIYEFMLQQQQQAAAFQPQIARTSQRTRTASRRRQASKSRSPSRSPQDDELDE